MKLTAKEMAEDAKVPVSDEDYYYNFHPDIFNKFCKQLLKEQREICANKIEAIYGTAKIIRYNILNSPEPKFE